MPTDLWSIDAVVLEYLIERLEVEGDDRVDLRPGLPGELPAGADRSLIRLKNAGLIKGVSIAERDAVLVVTEVTPVGLERAGAWPSPDQLPERIAALLTAMADRVADPEEKSRLRRTAESLTGVLRDVAVNVGSNQIPPLFG